jgi:hypothetical protein
METNGSKMAQDNMNPTEYEYEYETYCDARI